MTNRLLMTVSAVLMGISGIVLSFMPQETSVFFSDRPDAGVYVIVFQLMGALYFAFAMINWTARANLIGGIYGRPIAIGNLTHFVIGALALGKYYYVLSDPIILTAATVYAVFAIAFTKVFFTHPVSEEASAKVS
jgi:hypothetical protein